ncbi:hypothetical protein [Clostridium sp. JS66]|uniref:hypothetical protein n=1 Tax=Clostridium sp. JS66 TaxID=3064705 RepID=UPI00298E82E5|nr:hypothetical protein [Clostridium sp. JS66]WPC39202.1 hypothetical protein Q6H37_14890 [Clostridium sp. JS66]
MLKGSRHEEFRSGLFKTTKKKNKKKISKKSNEDLQSEALSLNIEDKWIKKKDIVILISILLLIICAIVKVHKSTYYNNTIYLDKKVTTLKEALKITDAEALKINKKAKLNGINGYINGSENIISKKPRLSMEYVKINKGLINNIEHRISIPIDLDNQQISGIYCSRNKSYRFEKYDFSYDKSKLDINDIYDIINKKVDMNKVLSGYKPSIDFDMYNNTCSIYVTYYKDKDAEQAKNNSSVQYRIEVDLRTKEIKNFSKKE